MSLLGFLATALSPISLLRQQLGQMLERMWPELLMLGVVVIGLKILRRPKVKGMVGEAMVNWAGLSRLDKTRYHVLKNLFVPHVSGDGMTEIDHVVVSAHGIFVIETKNYKGWIFGSAQDSMWTRSDYGKKRQFLNPLKQNKLHVDSLAAFLGLPQQVFHSVVFFAGEAKLKTQLPKNVMTSGLFTYIGSKRDILLDPAQVDRVWKTLTEHEASMDKSKVRRAHVDRLSARRQR